MSGDNKCKACGQWAGRGHRCPAVTSQPSSVPGAVGVPTVDSGLTTDDRVSRARTLLAESETVPRSERQQNLVESIQFALSNYSVTEAYETVVNGRPSGAVTISYAEPMNPREMYADTNVAKIGVFGTYQRSFSSLNEVPSLNGVYRMERDEYEETLDGLQAEYPRALIVPLACDPSSDTVTIASDGDIRNGHIGGFAVIDRDTVDGEFGGSETAATDALSAELRSYSAFAGGEQWEMAYIPEDSVGEVRVRGYEGEDPSSDVMDFVSEHCRQNVRLGTRLG